MPIFAAAAVALTMLGDVPLPTGYAMNPDPDIVDFALEEFDAGGKPMRVEGRRAAFAAHLEPASDAEIDATAQWAAAARKAGWRIVDAAPYLNATKTIRGVESWLHGMCFASSDCRFILIQKTPRVVFLKLEPPKPGPVAALSDKDDFPYLGHWPEATLGSIEEGGWIDATGDDDKEPTLVGPGVQREYKPAKQVGAWEFVVTYREALEKAGWKVIRAVWPSDAVVLAHYAKNGRDVYVYMHCCDPLAYNVVDVGAAAEAKKLAAELKAKGHVALYGIYFDVDSAQLKPESDATLQQIVALLKADPALKLEVQGHTDATGGRPHNQVLSDQRAASVVVYLTKAGVGADRLRSAGYADTKPVADNDSSEGRAKNRRVELVRR